MPRRLISNLLSLVGAIVGGVVGFYTFGWLVGQGFYGLMIPGALLGLGCGLGAQHHSLGRGLLCGAAALPLALFSEWWFLPFNADKSWSFFIGHLTNLQPLTWLMAGAGALIAFWIAKDAGYRWRPERSPPAPSR